jgi:membrane protein
MIVAMTVPDALRPGWRERVAQFAQALSTWPWHDTVRTLRERFREDRLGLTASSLTFTTLIALVPMLTVMLAVFSAFPMFSAFRNALEKYFLQSLVPDSIARPVLGALNQFATQAKGLGSMGVIVLVLTAIALMLTIDRTLNAIWRVRTPRPIAQRVLVYWAAVTLGPLALGVSLSLTSYAITASQGVVKGLPGGLRLVLDVLEFALLTAAITGLFHYVPNTNVRWRHALLGGVFVGIGFEVAKRLLAWYVRAVPTYTTVYGAFATVPIFLIWIYLGWLIVLFGAVIAAYAPSWQMKVARRPPKPGMRFELAIVVLRELATARATSVHGLALDAMAERLRIDPLQIEPIVDALVGLDWVGRLDEPGDGQRLVLLADPEATPGQPLVAAFLLDPSPVVRGFWRRAQLADMTLAQLLEA